jgi:hypothetical protein
MPKGTFDIKAWALIGAQQRLRPLVCRACPNGVYYVAVHSVNADGSGLRSNEVVVSVPSGGGGGGCSSVPSSLTRPTRGRGKCLREVCRREVP